MMKMCRGCGLQKPLAAFLQLSEKGGLTYGGFCATCRGTGKNKEKAISIEEGGSTTSEYKIDAKVKLQTEVDQRAFQKRTLEGEQRDRRLKAFMKKQRIQKTQVKTGQERSHREKYLSKKAASESKKAPTSSTAQTIQAHANKEAFAKEQRKEQGGVNYQVEVRDTGFSGKIKHHSAVFRQLKAWLGNSAFVRNVEKMKLNQARRMPF